LTTTANEEQLQKTAAVLNSHQAESAHGEEIARLQREIHALLWKCKVCSRNIKFAQQSRSASSPTVFVLFDKATAAELVSLYVTHFESVFRIVHVPSLWKEYELVWAKSDGTGAVSRHKLRLIIALGLLFYKSSHEDETKLAHARQWVLEAQEWLSAPMKKNRISSDSLQVQCLLILARQALAIGGDLVSIATSTLVRMAMHMGLHLDPSHFQAMGIL
jgi:hypothetical protein